MTVQVVSQVEANLQEMVSRLQGEIDSLRQLLQRSLAANNNPNPHNHVNANVVNSNNPNQNNNGNTGNNANTGHR